MIGIKHKGNFKHLDLFFRRVSKGKLYDTIKPYADLGVQALSAATPKKTGKTANSWSYEIVKLGNTIKIYWTNDNVNQGYHIAILLQYGHGLKGGGYVVGRDYINPAMRPVFDQIADNIWKEVTSV